MQRMAGGVRVEKMPGHWLLARLGKRVLRPGGVEATRRMLEALEIGVRDEVVEFAPGLGATARMALERRPASYTGVERDREAARRVAEILRGDRRGCVVGDAAATGLASGCASVVFGEAMLTMQREAQKRRIAGEAYRLLRPGGRYGIHELCLVPEEIDGGMKEEIREELSRTVRVGARPLTPGEWQALLESCGFEVTGHVLAPMRLLEPGRILRDEGPAGTLRFAANLLRDGGARARVLAMRRLFRRYRNHLAAIVLVARKPTTP
ncbi:Methyltransferase type 11 [Rubrobacter xylanophilus DSM 9941]|uniref:Methyltransferase type 11 n=2 Tax=Rubrobacter xylanophilus TaxID=49319 RepID=Q1AWS5_RUBXD|nr:Methyltransferase type 11 [Rubrobacter xylanophilus DSM 9941]